MQMGERIIAGPSGFWVEEVVDLFFVLFDDGGDEGRRWVQGNPVTHRHVDSSQVIVGVGAHDLDVLRLQFQSGEQQSLVVRYWDGEGGNQVIVNDDP